jgi:S-adenosylmethionine:tRNA ribosyltransferase-isomerase
MMQDVRQISIENYRYELPENRIALYPLEQRDQSKLLVYRDGLITSAIYHSLPSFLDSQSLLVMNNTKVVQARLLFVKESGGVIEVFCLEPAGKQQIEEGLSSKGRVIWNCMVGGLGKWKQPVLTQHFKLSEKEIILEARIIAKKEEYVEVAFTWNDDTVSFGDIMSCAGHVPLPPYLQRKAEAEDTKRYQTVYAQKQGSVAAPTAGLHFTERLLNELVQKGIEFAELTLHVGAGTFLPVKSATMSGHNMHKEWIAVDIHLLNQLIDAAEKNVIAVGTTSLRTLETLYWMGVKSLHQPEATLQELEIQQWDPYQIKADNRTKKDALQSLAAWMKRKGSDELVCTTQLLIAPGYAIKMADAILTNFHQPSSTLLLLVAACIGEDWRKVYEYALAHDYRFLSYGDGSLLWCRKDLPEISAE